MNEEELQREIVSGAFSMQVADCERNIRIQFEKLQQENKNLVCNNIILNEDRRIMSKQLNDIKDIIKECKMLYPHEFDWEEQADNILNIIERSNSDESSD